jgi:uncharacterized protein
MRVILWRGMQYKSWESCSFKEQDAFFKVESTVTGNFKSTIFTTKYELLVNSDWYLSKFKVGSNIEGAEPL